LEDERRLLVRKNKFETPVYQVDCGEH